MISYKNLPKPTHVPRNTPDHASRPTSALAQEHRNSFSAIVVLVAVAPTLLFPPASSTITVKACISEVIQVLASRCGLNSL